jgi:hypothetical protein
MSSASDGHTVGETAKLFVQRLIDWPNEVRVIMRDRDAGTGIPNHLQELLLLGVHVLSNLREGLLDPIRNGRNGRQVRFRHIFQKSRAIIDKKPGIRASKLRRQGLTVARLGAMARLRVIGVGKASTDLVRGRLKVPEAIGRVMAAAMRIVHPMVTALGIVRWSPAGVETGSWLPGHVSLSRRTFAKKSHKGLKETSEIRQDLEIEAMLGMPTVKLEVGEGAKTERKALVIAVMGPNARTGALSSALHLGLQFLHRDPAGAAKQSQRVGERRGPPSGDLENNPNQDKPERSGKGDSPV